MDKLVGYPHTHGLRGEQILKQSPVEHDHVVDIRYTHYTAFSTIFTNFPITDVCLESKSMWLMYALFSRSQSDLIFDLGSTKWISIDLVHCIAFGHLFLWLTCKSCRLFNIIWVWVGLSTFLAKWTTPNFVLITSDDPKIPELCVFWNDMTPFKGGHEMMKWYDRVFEALKLLANKMHHSPGFLGFFRN